MTLKVDLPDVTFADLTWQKSLLRAPFGRWKTTISDDTNGIGINKKIVSCFYDFLCGYVPLPEDPPPRTTIRGSASLSTSRFSLLAEASREEAPFLLPKLLGSQNGQKSSKIWS